VIARGTNRFPMTRRHSAKLAASIVLAACSLRTSSARPQAFTVASVVIVGATSPSLRGSSAARVHAGASP
ncbi:MAG: hypothetical protein ACTH31_12935, partial [Pseudoclavibacter sp.]